MDLNKRKFVREYKGKLPFVKNTIDKFVAKRFKGRDYRLYFRYEYMDKNTPIEFTRNVYTLYKLIVEEDEGLKGYIIDAVYAVDADVCSIDLYESLESALEVPDKDKSCDAFYHNSLSNSEVE